VPVVSAGLARATAVVLAGIALGLAWLSLWGRVAVLAVAVAAVGAFAYDRERYLVAVCAGALLARLAIIVVDIQVGLLKHPPIMFGHNLRAITQYHALLRGEVFVDLVNQSEMRRVVALLLTPFYAIFGEWPVSGRIAIATYSLSMGVGIYGVARRLTTQRLAIGVTAATLLWPSVLYRSTVIQRETVLAGCMIVLVWIVLRMIERIRLRDLLAVLPLLGLVVVFREENLALLIAVVGVAFLVRDERFKRNLATAAVVLSLPISYFLLNADSITGYGITAKDISDFAQQRATGTAAYLINLTYGNWIEILLWLPVKIVYYLFMPLPWYWSSPQIALVGMNGLLLLGATVLAVQGGLPAWRRSRTALVPAVFLIIGITTYAVIELNYGAAFRRRVQFTPFILLFAAIRLSEMGLEIRLPSIADGSETSTPSTDGGVTRDDT